MKIFKFYFSLIIAKCIYTAMRITKLSSGTSVIGLITLKICPDFLTYINDYIKASKINVTGTNGKTTTSGLISHIIKSNGNSLINNSMGANLLSGVVNAFAISLNPFKKVDYSVMESDEAFLEKIYEKLDANYLLVTNLFRDQLDRYGELATTKQFIQNGINKKENLNLILNADDPLVASLDGKNKIFYGVESVYFADDMKETKSSVEETFTCPCGKTLKYEKKFFAQQGHYYCDCGYKRPDVKYKADITIYKTHSVLNINGEEFETPLVGLFNAYNTLGAIALCKELGIENINQHLKDFKVAFGRSEIKYLNGKQVLIQLIKNPVGTNEVLKTVDLNSNILIIINDNYADGRDVSWLWDAEFENIKDAKKEVVISGNRANDMTLRLKYAGIKNVKIINNIDKAIDYIGEVSESNITILPTYTALLRINKNKTMISQ